MQQRELVITIPGEPQSWDRAGLNTRGKIQFFDRKAKEKSFIKQSLSAFVRTTPLNSPQAVLQQEMFMSSISLDITCFFSPPASFNKRDKILLGWGLLYKKTRPDIDNLCKLIMDAGNGILYKDDAQIVSLSSKKFFSHNPRTVIRIGIMDIDKTIREVVHNVHFDKISDFCRMMNHLQKLIDEHKLRLFKGEKEDLELIQDIIYTLSRAAYECDEALEMMLKHKNDWRFIQKPFKGYFA